MDASLRVYADPTTWPREFRDPLDRAADDCRYFAANARHHQLDQRWRELAPTWEEFCEQKLGYPAEFVEAVIAGVRALGEEAPIPMDVAASEGRRVRIAESKRLVEQEGMSLRQAAEVLGVSHDTVMRDVRVSERSLATEKSDTPSASQRRDSRKVYLPTDVTVAAQKIRAKFGDEFAHALAHQLTA